MMSDQKAVDAAPARQRRRENGSALIEITLLCPWFLFLFVGVVDLGFYTYSLIGVENAARVAAEYTSKSTSVAADQSRGGDHRHHPRRRRDHPSDHSHGVLW